MISWISLILLPAAQEGFRVTTDRTVDTTSLETIVRDVTRLWGAKTNDERAIALHTWLHHTIFHAAYPVESPPQSVGPLKVINVYGWGLCGGQHTVLKALFETAGWKVRYRGWKGHTTIEVFYDDRWHYFDTFLKCYYWTRDRRTVAGQDDINGDPAIVLDGPKDGRVPPDHYLCCGDSAEGVVAGCKTSKPYPVAKPEEGWASVTGRDQGYSTALRLPAGASVRLDWQGDPGQVAVKGPARHSCGTKDFRSDRTLGPILEHYGPRNHSNGRLSYTPDFSKAADVADAVLSGVEARDGKLVAAGGRGTALFRLPLPFVYVGGKVGAQFEGGDGTLSVSTDGGRTWQAAEGEDLTSHIRQKYDVQIRAEFPGALAKFRFEAVVEHNRSARPYLLPGPNTVTVSTPDNKLPRDRLLSVAYAFQEASTAEPARRTRWEGQGVTYGDPRLHRQEVTTLPFTYRIDVGGNTPPKMISLELAVRGR